MRGKTDSVVYLDINGSDRVSVARGLKKNGIDIHATVTGTPITRYSKYIDTYDQLGRPDISELLNGQQFFNSSGGVKLSEFKSNLMGIINKYNPDAIIPHPEEYVLALSWMKDEIQEKVDMSVPDFTDVVATVDKSKTVQRANQNGMVTPNSHFPEDPDDIRNIFEIEDLPVVIRPSVSRGASGVHYCSNVEQGLKAFNKIKEYSDPLVQEYVEGREFTGDLVAGNDHNLVDYFIDEQIILSGSSETKEGGGIYSVTCRQENVEKEYKKIPEAFDWVGPACPEYIVDKYSGEAKLMEINPRMSNHTPLGIFSGVNTAYLYYKIVKNENIEYNINYELDNALWDPYQVLKTNQFDKINKKELINRYVNRSMLQNRYLYDDPIYSLLAIGNDVKNALFK